MIHSQIKRAFCYPWSSFCSRFVSSANLGVKYPYYSSISRTFTGNACARFPIMPPDEPIQYHWINGVERLEMYKPGGYHPVMINDLLHDRYRIVDKLGFGGYSTIWLARDERLNCYVAVKVQISNRLVTRREPSILRALSSPETNSPTGHSAAVHARDTIPAILDEFDIEGPNGTHLCYTVAPAQGNLRQAKFSRLFPIEVARALAARLTIAVCYVHSRGFVHGDIHSRNVLVKIPATFDDLSVDQFHKRFGKPETVPISRVDGKPLSPNAPSEAVEALYLGKKAQDFTLADARGLVLSDFGEAFAPTTEERLGKNCHTPLAMRAPEALFEPSAPLSYPSDIWALGTAIWEILGMKFIFSESETRDITVAQQIEVLGSQNFPPSWQKQWERPSVEGNDIDDQIPRRPTGIRESWPPLERAFEEFVQKYRRTREAAGVFGEDETRAILDLMRGMLKFRPEERLTIDEVLRSEWMVKWALPQLD